MLFCLWINFTTTHYRVSFTLYVHFYFFLYFNAKIIQCQLAVEKFCCEHSLSVSPSRAPFLGQITSLTVSECVPLRNPSGPTTQNHTQNTKSANFLSYLTKQLRWESINNQPRLPQLAVLKEKRWENVPL